jgi:hypothetical protein
MFASLLYWQVKVTLKVAVEPVSVAPPTLMTTEPISSSSMTSLSLRRISTSSPGSIVIPPPKRCG